MDRPINKESKNNKKCEHCQFWLLVEGDGMISQKCRLTHEPKNYWNRCKRFEWNEKLNYKAADVPPESV